MPYLLGDLDDRQTYHPRKLRQAEFSGTTYHLRTGRVERAEFAGGALAIRPPSAIVPRPRLGGLGARARGMAKNAAKRVGKVAGAISRTRVGQAIGRGIQGAVKRVRKGIGMAARSGLGRGIGRMASRATGMVGGRGAMRKVGSAFRGARRFSSSYLMSDLATFNRRPRLTGRFTR